MLDGNESVQMSEDNGDLQMLNGNGTVQMSDRSISADSAPAAEDCAAEGRTATETSPEDRDGLIDLPFPIVVEGRYDKIRLASVTSAPIITTDGFGLFRNKKKLGYLRRLCDSMGGIVILTDPDGAGLLIRSYLRTALGEGRRIYNVYVPRVTGKERRKPSPSKEGVLGVEGIGSDELKRILSDFLSDVIGTDGRRTERCCRAGEKNCAACERNASCPDRPFTKAELYAAGLSGRDGSAERRARLCAYLGLPEDISAGALAEAIDLLHARDRLQEFLRTDNAACDGGDEQ